MLLQGGRIYGRRGSRAVAAVLLPIAVFLCHDQTAADVLSNYEAKVNTDYPGFDLMLTRNTNVYSCATACAARSDCKMFMFGTISWCSNCCWLKTRIGTPTPLNGLTSYLPTIGSTCNQAPDAQALGSVGWPESCAGKSINDTCTVACFLGYNGPGYAVTCVAKNTWGEVSGSCIQDRCSSPPTTDAPVNSLGWPASCTNSTKDYNCTAKCDSAFGAGYWSVCNGKDNWSAVQGSCPEACFGPPTAVPPQDSTGWACIAGVRVGKECAVGCATNFRGRPVANCIGKNQWSEVTGTCEPMCKTIHRGCETCHYTRTASTALSGKKGNELVCVTCFAGWRLRRDRSSKICDCAPGFTYNGTSDARNSWCVPCPIGQYCPGGNEEFPDSPALSCSDGLATIVQGAKSENQCYTKPGYGRSSQLVGTKLEYEVYICPIGTYNVGGNTAGCSYCGTGLTTIEPGATNVSMCTAPAGSFAERGTSAKLCPKGTYTTDYNNLPACIPCPTGTTTKGENSTSPEHCNRAMIGYYLLNATAAALCPLGSYQGREAAVYKCDECPHGWQTQDQGSGGNAECMAPPGFELKEGNDMISECDIGYWKEGWNKNPCTKCGSGLSTAATGAVTKDACLIPAGFGLVSTDPMLAVMCANGSYGLNTTRAVVQTSRCMQCEPNMYTNDTLSGVPATEGYISELDCLVKPGWGISASGQAEICPPGTFNAGFNRKPCQQCGTGFTSIAAGGENEDVCVVQAGWTMDTTHNTPKPCDVGTWSIGGNETDRNGVCQVCPQGFTTQKDESESLADCDVCAAGYGGAACALCPYNTYSTGVLKAGDDCLPCASATVSARGSIDSTLCVQGMVDADRDAFPLSDESKWTDSSNANAALDCQFACSQDLACAMFKFNTAPAAAAAKCQMLLEDVNGTQVIGIKADVRGIAYAFYKMPADLEVGVLISDSGSKTPQQCMEACNAASRCELVSLEAAAMPNGTSACKLYGSEYAEWVGGSHMQGSRLYADILLGTNTPSGP